MTVENLHDAIGQLPSDLIAQADQRRSRKRKPIPWQRCGAMAACFCLLIGLGVFCSRLFAPKGSTEAAQDVSMESVMMQENMMGAAKENRTAEDAPTAEILEEEAAPREEGPFTTGDTGDAAPMETVAAGENFASAASGSHAHTPQDPELCIDHTSGGWCGNMTAEIHMDGADYSLSGTDAVTLTDILYFLPYSEENLCRCMAEFTVNTEMGSGYEINLTEYFVRHQGGQASLTEEDAQQIQSILDTLEIVDVIPSE